MKEPSFQGELLKNGKATCKQRAIAQCGSGTPMYVSILFADNMYWWALELNFSEKNQPWCYNDQARQAARQKNLHNLELGSG